MEIQLEKELTEVVEATKKKRTRASKAVLATTKVNGVEYVALTDLENYQLTEKRKQLNCLPSLSVYNQVEAYCADLSMTKAAFMIEALSDYLVKLDEMHGK
jgi:uncharacterized protein YfkK (UPF0435 family)